MKLLESRLYHNDIKRAISNATIIDDLTGKTIFITGGLGLIASAIVDVLAVAGHTVVYIGARNKQNFQDRYGNCENIKFVQYDALEEFSESIKPNYIIHGAGLASPELYTSKPVETVLSNFDGVHTLLRFAKNNEVSRLLYISSSEVYGKKITEDPFVEGVYGEVDIDNIRSSYVIAKRSSEMLCKAYASEYDVDTIIVRPGHIYGPSAKLTDKRISSDFAFKAAKGENLDMKSPGLQKRSYCYSIDCAIQILTVLVKGEKGQAYNIGHDEVTSIREMAEILAKSGGVKLSLVEPSEIEIKNFNPMSNSSLDNSKVKTLGYKDTFSVEEGLAHTVKILREVLYLDSR